MDKELELFYNKWKQMKPKENSNMKLDFAGDEYQKLQDWSLDWEAKQKDIQLLQNNFASFNLPPYQNALVTKIDQEMKYLEVIWTLYKEFADELRLLEDQDWIVFRNKLIQFTALTEKWHQSISNNQEQNYVKEFLQKNIKSLK